LSPTDLTSVERLRKGFMNRNILNYGLPQPSIDNSIFLLDSITAYHFWASPYHLYLRKGRSQIHFQAETPSPQARFCSRIPHSTWPHTREFQIGLILLSGLAFRIRRLGASFFPLCMRCHSTSTSVIRLRDTSDGASTPSSFSRWVPEILLRV